MISAALVRYVLTAAIRDRLLLSILAVVGLGVCLSLFSASSALIEQNQFAVVYMASGLRILGLAGLMLFAVFFIRRLFDSRDIEYLLSRPISRISLILSMASALSILAVGAGALLTLIVSLFAHKIGQVSGLLLWMSGVTAEFVLIVNVALFFAMVLSSPVTAGMAVMGFYVLGRMIGQLLGIAQNPPVFFPGYELINGLMKLVSMLIPRLDLMTQTSWLIYGAGTVEDYGFIILQTLVFVVLVLTAALIDLVRRQF